MADRPDIVLIMTDQQRFDQVGYASGGHFATPHLDALAARGVAFDTAYSAATVCVPARNVLLTGVHPHRLPTQDNGAALREGTWTVAHALRGAGYETALFGKMHFSPVHAQHGFDTMRLCEHLHAQALGPLSDTRDDRVDDYHDWLLAQGLPDWRFADGRPAVSTPEAFRFSQPLAVHPTNWIEHEVLTFLETRDRERPLFLTVSFPHPHAPSNPPEPYASMYDPADSRLPASDADANARLPMVFQLAAKSADERTGGVQADALRSFLAKIRALVKQIDDSMGRILAELDPTTTLVFYTSDHGDYAGNRGLLHKMPPIPFDDLARVPFVVAGPGVVGGRQVGAVVQSCDFALTSLDFAGVDPPDDIEFVSRSLRPILENRAAGNDTERVAFCATSYGAPMVRRGAYKYIRHSERDAAMLFDMVADPLEQIDHASEDAYREPREELAARLQRELARPVVDARAAAIESDS